ncbi:MAG: hypothetical protein IKK17_03825 [Oscillospiraceae bacterium]|nr:hypothetical protein [Oscillospiraceae bacterium]
MNIIQCIYNEIADKGYQKKNASKEYAILVKEYGDAAEKLEAVLDEEQKQLYFDVEAQRNLLAAEDEEWMFRRGFLMGTKFMKEVFLFSEF